MNMLDIMWMIAAVVFFYFAIMFWVYSRSGLRPFIFGTTAQNGEEGGTLENIPDDIQKDIESYRRSISLTVQTRFRIGAISMALAGGLAIVSLIMS